MKVLNHVAALACVASLAQVAQAQETSTNRVAAKTDWSVFVEEDPTECWSVSTPKEWQARNSDGNLIAVNRGQILLMVIYRPSAGAAGQVAYTGGYPFRRGSTVTVNIGGDEFVLLTTEDDSSTPNPEDEWAWLASPQDDARMVAAMKRGTTAVITGTSGRGNITEDTFSLLGFTAATEEAAQRCTS